MSKIKITDEEIEINGKTYVPKGTQSLPTIVSDDARIVVLQRGWIVVGRYKRVGDEGHLYNASVIRIWGTTKGLPELVNGPLAQTKLDKSEGLVRFNIGSEILMLDINIDKWEKFL